MKITSEEFLALKKVMIELTILDNDSNFNSDKLKKALDNIDAIKQYYVAQAELYKNSEIKSKYPAIHKKQGIVLIRSLYHGVDNDELALVKADVTLWNGEKAQIPYKELMPYNVSSDILFGEGKKNE